MAFPHKKALLVGATSGIGHTLAARLVKEGCQVVVSGRRQERLDEFVKTHGSASASAMKVDLSDLDTLPGFAARVIEEHPDLTCAFLNSGVQGIVDFSKPDHINIEDIGRELDVNYLSYLTLVKEFTPFFQSKNEETCFVFTSSLFALVPFPRALTYSATKAALHSFILCIRQQLAASGIKCVEIFPPLVQTEMTEEQQKESGLKGMPAEDCVQEVWEGLVRGDDDIVVGRCRTYYDAFVPKALECFYGFYEQFKGRFAS